MCYQKEVDDYWFLADSLAEQESKEKEETNLNTNLK
jgi:hypothetical protein